MKQQAEKIKEGSKPEEKPRRRVVLTPRMAAAVLRLSFPVLPLDPQARDESF